MEPLARHHFMEENATGQRLPSRSMNSGGSVAVIEAMYAEMVLNQGHDKTVEASWQELFDRAHLYFPKPDHPARAMGIESEPSECLWYAKNHGVYPKDSYGWTSRCATCVSDHTPPDMDHKIFVNDYVCIPSGDGEKEAVLKQLYCQPLVASLDNRPSFKNWDVSKDPIYEGCTDPDDVFKDKDGNPITALHSVLVVGYGGSEAENDDYFLIQNSYGTSWGHQGFGKLRRHLLKKWCYPIGCEIRRVRRSA